MWRFNHWSLDCILVIFNYSFFVIYVYACIRFDTGSWFDGLDFLLYYCFLGWSKCFKLNDEIKLKTYRWFFFWFRWLRSWLSRRSCLSCSSNKSICRWRRRSSRSSARSSRLVLCTEEVILVSTFDTSLTFNENRVRSTTRRKSLVRF